MNIHRVTLQRRFVHRFARTLLIVLAVVLIAGAINLIGIHLLGNVDHWSRWLERHGRYFLAWRLCLYAATVYGWWWMRNRVFRREGASDARRRLRRAEIAAVLAIFVLEVTLSVRIVSG